jgi:tetratricopeptide (TPR) repeat protein
MFAVSVSAQQQKADSLVNVLKTQKLTATEQLTIYMQICTLYNNYDNKKLLFYAKEAVSIAEKDEDKSWASRFNMILGQNCVIEEKYDSAMIYYNKSVAYAEQANNKDLQGGAYSMIGSMYTSLSQHDIALDYYLKALPCLEFSNRRKYGQALEHIGQLYKGINNLDKAIEYLEQAKVIAEEVNFPNSKIRCVL